MILALFLHGILKYEGIESNKISNNNINLNKEPELIWIDHEIERFENQKYLIQLKNILTIEVYKSIEEGINRIKEIKFKRIMVMLSKKMFEEFINLFKKRKKSYFLLNKYSYIYI